MTGVDPYLPPRWPSVLRDLCAVLLIVAGLAGLVVLAFHVPWQVSLAVGSVTAIAAGAALGMSR